MEEELTKRGTPPLISFSLRLNLGLLTETTRLAASPFLDYHRTLLEGPTSPRNVGSLSHVLLRYGWRRDLRFVLPREAR